MLYTDATEAQNTNLILNGPARRGMFGGIPNSGGLGKNLVKKNKH